jgi:hypothetical protein
VDIITRAQQKIQEILDQHKIKPLTDREEKVISGIMKEAREYYKKKGLISDEEWTIYLKTLESAGYL